MFKMLFLFLCAFGFLNYKVESIPTKLYYPDEIKDMENSQENMIDEDILEFDIPKQSIDLMPEVKKNLAIADEVVTNTSLENGKYFQGDMVFKPEQLEFLLSNSTDSDTILERTGILSQSKRWPKNHLGYVQVPYKIKDYHFSK